MLAGLRPSIGIVGDALDNALCETTTGPHRTECSHGPTPSWLNELVGDVGGLVVMVVVGRIAALTIKDHLSVTVVQR